MSTILSAIALAGTLAGAVMWAVSTLQHRRHISECADALVRHRRLNKRLFGCVAEMEHILDTTAPQRRTSRSSQKNWLGMLGLFGLRQEAEDHVADLGRHAVRLRWPDGYLAKTPLARKRCELAHGALVSAFQSLEDAIREYERGLTAAL
jgi:hypothetical protein